MEKRYAFVCGNYFKLVRKPSGKKLLDLYAAQAKKGYEPDSLIVHTHKVADFLKQMVRKGFVVNEITIIPNGFGKAESYSYYWDKLLQHSNSKLLQKQAADDTCTLASLLKIDQRHVRVSSLRLVKVQHKHTSQIFIGNYGLVQFDGISISDLSSYLTVLI